MTNYFVEVDGKRYDITSMNDQDLLLMYNYINSRKNQLDTQLKIIKEMLKARVRQRKQNIVAQAPDGKFVYTDVSQRPYKSVNYDKLYELLGQRAKDVITETQKNVFSVKTRKTLPTNQLEILEGQLD